MSNLNWRNARYWEFVTQVIRKKSFKEIGKKTVVFKPMRLDFTSSIVLGSNVFIAEGAWLMGKKGVDTTLRIEDETVIGNHSHIIAVNNVIIEDHVLIADKVFITDCTHEYEDITNPIIDQRVLHIGHVTIGKGSWLGENVCIIGASVGKHSVIGANSVVTKNIPDYCVACGNPAKIIKMYNLETKRWERIINKEVDYE